MRKIKKVCFVLLEAYPYFNPSAGQMTGGAELQFFNLSTALASKKNYRVSVIVGDYNQPKTETIDNVKLIRCFNAERSDNILRKLKQSFKFLRTLNKEKPEIVISTTNNTLVVLCSLYSFFSKSKHIHRIASNKDTGLERIAEFGFLARLYSWGMKKANKVLVQNLEQQQNLKQNFKKNSFLFKNSFITKPLIKTEKKYVLWVSRYLKLKRAELFIDLAEKIRIQEFVIICPIGKGKTNSDWLALKQKAQKVQNLRFIEFVNFSAIQDYFNKAILFVNTSVYEGFPNTFLQAAQGRTPIVSLSVNPDNFITKYDCGIVCNNNFDLMVKKVTELALNQRELKKKGEKCYRYLKENHDIKLISNQLDEIIQSMK